MAFDYRNQISVPDSEAPSISEMCTGVDPQELVGNQALQALCTFNADEQGDSDQTGLLDGLFGDERQVAGRNVGEGTDGLFGPIGSMSRMLDRASASVELADRFDVVPDDFVGPRLPNQVTESEYSQIVNTYSDIRTGNSNIGFDSSNMSGDAATNFRGNVMNDFASMMQTPSGRGMLTDMAYGRNADGTAHSTTIRGITNPSGAQSIPGGGNADPNTSNGVGTNSTIEYTPGATVNTAPGDAVSSIRSDAVLYHEMVHSNHMRLGNEDQRVLGNSTTPSTAANPSAVHARDNGLTSWEYQAVGLGHHSGNAYSENTYRSERTAMGDPMPQRTRYR